jgi:hypothetical protein
LPPAVIGGQRQVAAMTDPVQRAGVKRVR